MARRWARTSFAFWITSLQYTSVASSVIFVTTNPIFVAIASSFLLRERISPVLFLSILAAVTGGIIIGWGDLGQGPDPLYGDFLSLLGAIMATGYLLVGRRVRQKVTLMVNRYEVRASDGSGGEGPVLAVAPQKRMALKEQVTWQDAHITSLDWETYPILKFSEVPEVDVVLIDRPNEPPMGSGEPATVATASAIANAIFAACGARVRASARSDAP